MAMTSSLMESSVSWSGPLRVISSPLPIIELMDDEDEALVTTSASILRVAFSIFSTTFSTWASVVTVSSSCTYTVKVLKVASLPAEPAALERMESVELPSMAPTSSTPSTDRMASTTWSARSMASSFSVPSGMVTVEAMVLLVMEGMRFTPMENTPATEKASSPRATRMGRAL